AIAEPWRMACAWLTQMRAPLPPAFAEIEQNRWNMVARMSMTGMGSPTTSSAGRLFDAVAAICGVRLEVTYEGQAAIEFEALADPAGGEPYPFPMEAKEMIVLNPRPTVMAILADIDAGVPVATISARFHQTIAIATAEACAIAAERASLDTVVLSGGVFQNKLLIGLTAGALEDAGLRVLTPRLLPPNDGQIAYGQVAVAAAQLAAG
ncbi:MAG: hydrogenase maturation protein HypF, partial [Solirubrobacteraceae bacterium]|nr:hydrogenase maturation protein HypF [Solirubrobacteraceae bacterium]